MVKACGAPFRPVQYEFGKILVSGGYTSKPMAMVTKTVDDTDGKTNIREDGDDGELVDNDNMWRQPP